MSDEKVFKNTIPGSPVLSPESIASSVLPPEIKDFMIKNIPWKKNAHCENRFCSGTKLAELDNQMLCEYEKMREEAFNSYIPPKNEACSDCGKGDCPYKNL